MCHFYPKFNSNLFINLLSFLFIHYNILICIKILALCQHHWGWTSSLHHILHLKWSFGLKHPWDMTINWTFGKDRDGIFWFMLMSKSTLFFLGHIGFKIPFSTHIILFSYFYVYNLDIPIFNLKLLGFMFPKSRNLSYIQY